ncbi:hypothetical protein Daus18300_005567 [Diaporthe australafricana]|uniref:Uncharacterized protein n=1 Tax=Diaporthe australafricana TaxID=127596 RepID=A0ABR3X124_9PEZI
MHIPTTHRSIPNKESSADVEFYGNLAIYGLLAIAAVIILVMLALTIHDGFQFLDTPIDNFEDSSSEEDSEEEEEEAEPHDLTLTAEGRLVNNKSSSRPNVIHYGTFRYYKGTWYNAEGTPMTRDEWNTTVYDPLL